jgi:Ni/Co efflux regulator RcnB
MIFSVVTGVLVYAVNHGKSGENMHKLQAIVCSVVFSLLTTSIAYAGKEQQDVQHGQQQITQGSGSEGMEGQIADTAIATTVLDPSPGQKINKSVNAEDPYEMKRFFADFTHFVVGDTVPKLYRSKDYEVTQWAARHLPAPMVDSHWTYMGGNYVLITNDTGKILKAESGNIYYKH